MYVQLLFDFARETRTASAGENKPLPWFDEPRNDNERLLNWQTEWIRDKDRLALNRMYALGCEIAGKYISEEAKRNRNVRRLCRSDREEKAHNAITYIIARYSKVPGWAIRDSFTGYLYRRVQHELYYTRKVDKIVSFMDIEELYRRKKGT